MNKKSQMLGKIGISLVSFLGFVVFFVIFYFYIQPSSSTPLLSSQSAAVDAQIALLSYLRTPVAFENQTATMADMIVLWRQNSSYEEKLVSETKKILDSMEYRHTNPDTKEQLTRKYEIDFFSKPGFHYSSKLLDVISSKAIVHITCDDSRCDYYGKYYYLPLDYSYPIHLAQASLPLPDKSSINIGLWAIDA